MRLHLGLNPVPAVHGKKPGTVSLEHVLQLKSDLGKLLRIVGPDVRFQLAGGYSIPLTLEKYADKAGDIIEFPHQRHRVYREHHAFHLSIHSSELLKLEKRLAKPEDPDYRYILVSQKVSAHGWLVCEDKKADVYWSIAAGKAIERRTHGLRFIRLDSKGRLAIPHQTRLDYIDVYPYIYKNRGGVEVEPWFDGQFAIMKDGKPISGFSENEVYVLSWDKHDLKLPFRAYQGVSIEVDGMKVEVAGLPWIRLIKEKRARQDDADRFDIQIIDRYEKMLK